MPTDSGDRDTIVVWKPTDGGDPNSFQRLDELQCTSLELMKSILSTHSSSWTPLASRAAGVALLWLSSAAAWSAPFLQSNHDAYFPGEEIRIRFEGGPGNRKDWIGVYPVDIVPGSVGSTIWRYVDGTDAGNTGLVEGTIVFPTGLNLAGDWSAYFLQNDGYTKLATNDFRVVDPGSPLVRLEKRTYETGEDIVVTFTNGPAGAKDWVGIYKVGQTPGPTPSTIWSYVDGTQAGTKGVDGGTLKFPKGLNTAGEWVANFMVNDGYDIIATATFSVKAPAPVIPRVLSTSPNSGATDLSPALEFAATIVNGSSKVSVSTLRLVLDGGVVNPEVTTEGDRILVRYRAPGLAAPLTEHTWLLAFQDDATPANTVRAEVKGTVRAYRNIVLSDPVYFENFDAIAEGTLPVGWTEIGYSTPINEAADFGDLGSAAYRTWTVVDVARFRGSFVTYGNPENPAGWGTDYQRVLATNPANIVNGATFSDPLAKGRMLFGNSGYQNTGASQVLFLETRDFDLRGKTNVHLGFNSLWEQNQDSIAGIEYSTDAGKTWLPVAYLIDRADLITITNQTTGVVTVDAEATLNEPRNDVARYTDAQGNEIGGTYGAFVGVPIRPELAAFIEGRVNDDPIESKRVEWFRLAEADNRQTVRVRFFHAGTDSWYFGIDDFGLYAPSADSGPAPSLTVTRGGSEIVISWPAGATGYVLESASALGGAWQAVPGVAGTSHRITPAGSGAFFRLGKR